MFRALIRPELMFLLGAIQALFPYALWALGGGISDAKADIKYTPIAIWLLGYAAFFIGCRLVPGKTSANTRLDLRPYSRRIVIAAVMATLALLVQIALAVIAYGSLPLLSYIAGSGQMDVGTANDAQDSAGFGQFGLLIVSSYLATGVLLLLTILGSQERRRRLLLSTALLFTLLMGGLMNGKRQGMLMTAVYIGVGLLMYAGSLRRAIASLSFLPRNQFLRGLTLVGFLSLAPYLMGKLAEIRSMGADHVSGADEIVRYLEYPILNLSAQCDQAGGFGPYQFSLRYPLQHLLPFKLIDSWLAEDIPAPARIERTSPSGMFELIHWAWGIVGVVGYALLLGAFCTYVYRKASSDSRFLLIYPLCAYALFTAHSYNHFLNLTFVPLPSLLFWCGARLILKHKRTQSRHATGRGGRLPTRDRSLPPISPRADALA